MSYKVHSRDLIINGVPSRESLKNRISYYRKLRGMSQSDLGKFVGLTKASISKIESCRSGTTAYCAYKICRVLDVKFEDLFYFNYD